MKNKIIISLATCLLFVPLVSSATVNVEEELRSQIISLLRQVAELQAKLNQQTGPGPTGRFCHNFNTNLGVGNSGDDVSALHRILNSEGIPGKEPVTEYFRSTFEEDTASRITAFQEKYKNEILTPAGLSNGTGYLGARTRAKLNALYGCGGIAKPVCTDITGTTCPYTESDSWYPSKPSITLISPVGGETFSAGSYMGVSWKNNDYRSSVVNIYLYRGSHTGDYNYVARIGDVAQPNDGYQDWVIPASVAAGDNYFVRINLDVKDPEVGYDNNFDTFYPFSIVAPATTLKTTTGLCTSLSKNYGDTFVDVDAGTLSMNGRNYVVNGTVGMTAGANQIMDIFAYVPDGQSIGYIGAAKPGTPEAYNYLKQGILVATVQSGANPTDPSSPYGGIISKITSGLAKCTDYTR